MSTVFTNLESAFVDVRDQAARLDMEREDAFHALFRTAVDAFGLKPVARALDIGTGTVQRYAVGKAKPHIAMRKVIVRYLVESIDKKEFTTLRTDEDRAYEEEIAKPNLNPFRGW